MRAIRISALGGVFLVLLLGACADQRETIVNEHLQQQVASESGGALALSSFAKTNGYEQAMAGMKLYTIEWQAHITVQNDLWKNGGAFEGYWSSFRVMQGSPTAEDMMWARIGPTMPKEFVKGATVILTGESQLQKADNGWRVVNSRVKTEQTLNNERSPAALAELQRQNELQRQAQEQAQAAEAQRLAAIAEAEAREIEDARKKREAVYTTARNNATTIGQVECEVLKQGRGSSFMIDSVEKYKFTITSAGITKEIVKIRSARDDQWSEPADGQREVIWFDELAAKPGYYRGSASALDREISLKSDRLGDVELYCWGDQKTRTAADYLENTFNILQTAIDGWRSKYPTLARW